MAIEIRCADRLQKARDFADKLGPEARKSLEDQLTYLETYRNNTCLCELYPDFAPHSFGFNLMGPVKNDGSRDRWFVGGVIYYGPSETGVDGPQFSVDIEAVAGNPEAQKPRWKVNT
jgi:hypothetical protein